MDYPEIVHEQTRHSLPADLPERVLSILRQHIGKQNRISRRALVEAAFGVKVEGSLASSTLDRQVRMVLVPLQDRYPILASSGAGGYYYAGSAEEIACYAAELDSRAKKLLHKSHRLVRLAAAFKTEQQLSLPYQS